MLKGIRIVTYVFVSIVRVNVQFQLNSFSYSFSQFMRLVRRNCISHNSLWQRVNDKIQQLYTQNISLAFPFVAFGLEKA